MTSYKREDGSGGEIILLASDDPSFEFYTWCSDNDGKVPEQVHFIIEPTSEVKILFRFTGPNGISQVINAFIDHYEDVWGEWKREFD